MTTKAINAMLAEICEREITGVLERAIRNGTDIHMALFTIEDETRMVRVEYGESYQEMTVKDALGEMFIGCASKVVVL